LLDYYSVRQSLADAQPGAADLADNTCLTAQKLDPLLFAEPHFPQAMGHVCGGGKLLDAHVHTRPHTAQGAQKRLGAHGFSLFIGAMRLVHHATLRQTAPAGKNRSNQKDPTKKLVNNRCQPKIYGRLTFSHHAYV
jgi:hypothetical protein